MVARGMPSPTVQLIHNSRYTRALEVKGRQAVGDSVPELTHCIKIIKVIRGKASQSVQDVHFCPIAGRGPLALNRLPMLCLTTLGSLEKISLRVRDSCVSIIEAPTTTQPLSDSWKKSSLIGSWKNL